MEDQNAATGYIPLWVKFDTIARARKLPKMQSQKNEAISRRVRSLHRKARLRTRHRDESVQRTSAQRSMKCSHFGNTSFSEMCCVPRY